MSWIIEARLKQGGGSWEPISVERGRRVGSAIDAPLERAYHYATLQDAQIAFERYVGSEAELPGVIMRLATGGRRLIDQYDIRFVEAIRAVARNLGPLSDRLGGGGR